MLNTWISGWCNESRGLCLPSRPLHPYSTRPAAVHIRYLAFTFTVARRKIYVANAPFRKYSMAHWFLSSSLWFQDQVSKMDLNSVHTAAQTPPLGFALVVNIQWLITICPVLNAPNSASTQHINVEIVQGSISLNERRKAELAKLERAASTWPARACLMGLRALTKPVRTRKNDTQGEPSKMMRRKGKLYHRGGSSLLRGDSRKSAYPSARCDVITKMAARPRSPLEHV
jgi:hypothetical protein